MNQLLNYMLGIQTVFAQQSDKSSSVASATGTQIQDLFDIIIHSIPFWITGFLVILFSLLLAKIVKSTVENRMSEAGLEEEHQEVQIVAGRAASASVLLIGITAGLKIAGLDLTSIIAAAAFGVGFALKDIILNFVSGIIVLLQKQFTIGDWVKVKGTEGIIKSIQSRYTVIKKFDGTNVIVPNSELFKNQVNSLTTNPERRFQIDIAVDFYHDLKEVIDTLYKSIAKCDKILQHPKPSIIVQQPGKYYNSIRIHAWVPSKKGILKPISALVRQIHKDFYRKGWSFPYPTDHIYFDKDAQPDITTKAKKYRETHKRQKKNPAPIEAPAWLKQAANQQPSLASEQVAVPPVQSVTLNQQLTDSGAVQQQPSIQYEPQPQAYIQNIEVSPEVKIVSSQPVSEIVQENQVAQPIVVAGPIVQQEPLPTVAMPLPDVQSNNGVIVQ